MRRPAILFLFAILLWPSAASAEKRVALIIGNGAYTKVSKLANPTRDADAMDALFRAAGFDVVDTRRDLEALAMRRTLRNFSDRVRGADVAVMFFAGHGIEVNGTNYLIPVDATLERDIDVEDETVPLERITQILEPARRLRLIILDACRDNPFVRSMKRTITGRSIGRGLAEVRVLTADTLIAFAARAGSTAADGDGANSPYTTALVKHLPTPGLDLRLALGRVRDDVLKSTSHGQEPFVYGSLGGAEIALVSAASPVREAAPPAPPAVSEAERAWASIKDSKHVRDLEAFRRQYGKANLFYDGLAARRIEELRTEAAAAKAQAEADAKRRQEEGIAAKKKAAEDAKQQAAAAKKQAEADAKRREEESAAAKKRAAEEAQRRADAAAAAKKAEQEAAARAGAEAEAKRQAMPIEAERAWGTVKDTTDPSVLEAYIKQFGGTIYAAMARTRLQDLKKRQVATQDDADVASSWGLFGTWARNCSQAPSTENNHITYTRKPGGRVVEEVNRGDERNNYQLTGATIRASGVLEITTQRRRMRMPSRRISFEKGSDGRKRVITNVGADGTHPFVENGKFLSSGTQTDWLTRCR